MIRIWMLTWPVTPYEPPKKKPRKEEKLEKRPLVPKTESVESYDSLDVPLTATTQGKDGESVKPSNMKVVHTENPLFSDVPQRNGFLHGEGRKRTAPNNENDVSALEAGLLQPKIQSRDAPDNRQELSEPDSKSYDNLIMSGQPDDEDGALQPKDEDQKDSETPYDEKNKQLEVEEPPSTLFQMARRRSSSAAVPNEETTYKPEGSDRSRILDPNYPHSVTPDDAYIDSPFTDDFSQYSVQNNPNIGIKDGSQTEEPSSSTEKNVNGNVPVDSDTVKSESVAPVQANRYDQRRDPDTDVVLGRDSLSPRSRQDDAPVIQIPGQQIPQDREGISNDEVIPREEELPIRSTFPGYDSPSMSLVGNNDTDQMKPNDQTHLNSPPNVEKGNVTLQPGHTIVDKDGHTVHFAPRPTGEDEITPENRGTLRSSRPALDSAVRKPSERDHGREIDEDVILPEDSNRLKSSRYPSGWPGYREDDRNDDGDTPNNATTDPRIRFKDGDDSIPVKLQYDSGMHPGGNEDTPRKYQPGNKFQDDKEKSTNAGEEDLQHPIRFAEGRQKTAPGDERPLIHVLGYPGEYKGYPGDDPKLSRTYPTGPNSDKGLEGRDEDLIKPDNRGALKSARPRYGPGNTVPGHKISDGKDDDAVSPTKRDLSPEDGKRISNRDGYGNFITPDNRDPVKSSGPQFGPGITLPGHEIPNDKDDYSLSPTKKDLSPDEGKAIPDKEDFITPVNTDALRSSPSRHGPVIIVPERGSTDEKENDDKSMPIDRDKLKSRQGKLPSGNPQDGMSNSQAKKSPDQGRDREYGMDDGDTTTPDNRKTLPSVNVEDPNNEGTVSPDNRGALRFGRFGPHTGDYSDPSSRKKDSDEGLGYQLPYAVYKRDDNNPNDEDAIVPDSKNKLRANRDPFGDADHPDSKPNDMILKGGDDEQDPKRKTDTSEVDEDVISPTNRDVFKPVKDFFGNLFKGRPGDAKDDNGKNSKLTTPQDQPEALPLENDHTVNDEESKTRLQNDSLGFTPETYGKGSSKPDSSQTGNGEDNNHQCGPWSDGITPESKGLLRSNRDPRGLVDKRPNDFDESRGRNSESGKPEDHIPGEDYISPENKDNLRSSREPWGPANSKSAGAGYKSLPDSNDKLKYGDTNFMSSDSRGDVLRSPGDVSGPVRPGLHDPKRVDAADEDSIVPDNVGTVRSDRFGPTFRKPGGEIPDDQNEDLIKPDSQTNLQSVPNQTTLGSKESLLPRRRDQEDLITPENRDLVRSQMLGLPLQGTAPTENEPKGSKPVDEDIITPDDKDTVQSSKNDRIPYSASPDDRDKLSVDRLQSTEPGRDKTLRKPAEQAFEADRKGSDTFMTPDGRTIARPARDGVQSPTHRYPYSDVRDSQRPVEEDYITPDEKDGLRSSRPYFGPGTHDLNRHGNGDDSSNRGDSKPDRNSMFQTGEPLKQQVDEQLNADKRGGDTYMTPDGKTIARPITDSVERPSNRYQYGDMRDNYKPVDEDEITPESKHGLKSSPGKSDPNRRGESDSSSRDAPKEYGIFPSSEAGFGKTLQQPDDKGLDAGRIGEDAFMSPHGRIITRPTRDGVHHPSNKNPYGNTRDRHTPVNEDSITPEKKVDLRSSRPNFGPDTNDSNSHGKGAEGSNRDNLAPTRDGVLCSSEPGSGRTLETPVDEELNDDIRAGNTYMTPDSRTIEKPRTDGGQRDTNRDPNHDTSDSHRPVDEDYITPDRKDGLRSSRPQYGHDTSYPNHYGKGDESSNRDDLAPERDAMFHSTESGLGRTLQMPDDQRLNAARRGGDMYKTPHGRNITAPTRDGVQHLSNRDPYGKTRDNHRPVDEDEITPDIKDGLKSSSPDVGPGSHGSNWLGKRDDSSNRNDQTPDGKGVFGSSEPGLGRTLQQPDDRGINADRRGEDKYMKPDGRTIERPITDGVQHQINRDPNDDTRDSHRSVDEDIITPDRKDGLRSDRPHFGPGIKDSNRHGRYDISNRGDLSPDSIGKFQSSEPGMERTLQKPDGPEPNAERWGGNKYMTPDGRMITRPTKDGVEQPSNRDLDGDVQDSHRPADEDLITPDKKDGLRSGRPYFGPGIKDSNRLGEGDDSSNRGDLSPDSFGKFQSSEPGSGRTLQASDNQGLNAERFAGAEYMTPDGRIITKPTKDGVGQPSNRDRNGDMQDSHRPVDEDFIKLDRKDGLRSGKSNFGPGIKDLNRLGGGDDSPNTGDLSPERIGNFQSSEPGSGRTLQASDNQGLNAERLGDVKYMAPDGKIITKPTKDGIRQPSDRDPNSDMRDSNRPVDEDFIKPDRKDGLKSGKPNFGPGIKDSNPFGGDDSSNTGDLSPDSIGKFQSRKPDMERTLKQPDNQGLNADRWGGNKYMTPDGRIITRPTNDDVQTPNNNDPYGDIKDIHTTEDDDYITPDKNDGLRSNRPNFAPGTNDSKHHEKGDDGSNRDDLPPDSTGNFQSSKPGAGRTLQAPDDQGLKTDRRGADEYMTPAGRIITRPTTDGMRQPDNNELYDDTRDGLRPVDGNNITPVRKDGLQSSRPYSEPGRGDTKSNRDHMSPISDPHRYGRDVTDDDPVLRSSEPSQGKTLQSGPADQAIAAGRTQGDYFMTPDGRTIRRPKRDDMTDHNRDPNDDYITPEKSNGLRSSRDDLGSGPSLEKGHPHAPEPQSPGGTYNNPLSSDDQLRLVHGTDPAETSMHPRGYKGEPYPENHSKIIRLQKTPKDGELKSTDTIGKSSPVIDDSTENSARDATRDPEVIYLSKGDRDTFQPSATDYVSEPETLASRPRRSGTGNRDEDEIVTQDYRSVLKSRNDRSPFRTGEGEPNDEMTPDYRSRLRSRGNEDTRPVEGEDVTPDYRSVLRSRKNISPYKEDKDDSNRTGEDDDSLITPETNRTVRSTRDALAQPNTGAGDDTKSARQRNGIDLDGFLSTDADEKKKPGEQHMIDPRTGQFYRLGPEGQRIYTKTDPSESSGVPGSLNSEGDANEVPALSDYQLQLKQGMDPAQADGSSHGHMFESDDPSRILNMQKGLGESEPAEGTYDTTPYGTTDTRSKEKNTNKSPEVFYLSKDERDRIKTNTLPEDPTEAVSADNRIRTKENQDPSELRHQGQAHNTPSAPIPVDGMIIRSDIDPVESQRPGLSVEPTDQERPRQDNLEEQDDGDAGYDVNAPFKFVADTYRRRSSLDPDSYLTLMIDAAYSSEEDESSTDPLQRALTFSRKQSARQRVKFASEEESTADGDGLGEAPGESSDWKTTLRLDGDKDAKLSKDTSGYDTAMGRDAAGSSTTKPKELTDGDRRHEEALKRNSYTDRRERELPMYLTVRAFIVYVRPGMIRIPFEAVTDARQVPVLVVPDTEPVRSTPVQLSIAPDDSWERGRRHSFDVLGSSASQENRLRTLMPPFQDVTKTVSLEDFDRDKEVLIIEKEDQGTVQKPREQQKRSKSKGSVRRKKSMRKTRSFDDLDNEDAPVWLKSKKNIDLSELDGKSWERELEIIRGSTVREKVKGFEDYSRRVSKKEELPHPHK